MSPFLLSFPFDLFRPLSPVPRLIERRVLEIYKEKSDIDLTSRRVDSLFREIFDGGGFARDQVQYALSNLNRFHPLPRQRGRCFVGNRVIPVNAGISFDAPTEKPVGCRVELSIDHSHRLFETEAAEKDGISRKEKITRLLFGKFLLPISISVIIVTLRDFFAYELLQRRVTFVRGFLLKSEILVFEIDAELPAFD